MKKLFSVLIGLMLMMNIAYSQNSWTFVSYLPSPSPSINSIAVVNANVIWASAAVAGGAARVYRTVNGGVTWQLKNTGLPATMNAYGCAALDSLTCWIGNDIGMTIYKTTDGGNTWVGQLTVAGSFTDGIHFVDANTGWLYADPTAVTGQPYQIRSTTNGGTNWVLNATSPTSSTEYGVINAWDWSDNNHIWFGSANTTASATFAKVYYSSTGIAGTFTAVSVPGTGGTTGCYYQAVAFTSNTDGMIGSSAGDIKKTTNGGVSYTTVTNPGGLVTGSFAVMNMCKDASGKIRLAIDSSGGAVIWTTTNLGTAWVREQIPVQGSASTISHMVFLDANHGFASLGSPSGAIGGLLKYSPVVGIGNISGEVPSEFKLDQNYPNPFNPATVIKFAMPRSGYVTLKVYNALGKEVETLLSENMIAGGHEVVFDASSLSSGLYFYQIITNGFTDTKKMLLVK